MLIFCAACGNFLSSLPLITSLSKTHMAESTPENLQQQLAELLRQDEERAEQRRKLMEQLKEAEEKRLEDERRVAEEKSSA